MADIGTTASALGMSIAKLIYPDGKMGLNSITGRITIVRRGWLLPSDLTGDCSLKKGIDYVTVNANGASYKEFDDPLGYPWRTVSVADCPIVLTVSGTALTVSIPDGAVPSGVVGAQVSYAPGDENVSGTAVAYAPLSTDGPADIAAALAAQIANATASGATVTFPGALGITARTSGQSTQRRITRRQEQVFRVSIFSASWKGRDALGSALDAAASSEWFIPNTDGTFSRIVFSGAQDIDTQQTEGIFRRDLLWKVTFDTIQEQKAAVMLWNVGRLNVQCGDLVALTVAGATLPNQGVLTDESGSVYLDAAGNLVLLPADPYSGLSFNAAGNVISA